MIAAAGGAARGAARRQQRPPARSRPMRRDVAPPLRAAVAAYRAGDLATAEQAAAPAGRQRCRRRGLARRACCSIAAGRARRCRLCSMPPTQARPRARIASAWSSPKAPAACRATTPRALELFEKAAAAGHRRAADQRSARCTSAARARRATSCRRAPGSRRRRRRTIPTRSTRWAAPWTKATGRPWPIRCAPPISIAAPRSWAIRWPRCATAWRWAKATACAGISRRADWLIYADKSGVPEAALAMGDLVARTPASRDKAANEKIVQAAVTWYEAAAQGRRPRRRSSSSPTPISPAPASTRDPQQALQWYARAAQQGMPEAQHALGLFLIGGAAGTADPVEGYKWLVLAERGGYPDSQSVREKAGGKDRRSRPQAGRGAGRQVRRQARAAVDRARRAAAAARRRSRSAMDPVVPARAGAARHHARRVPRRLPADAPGRPFGAARDAAAGRPARRHLRGRRAAAISPSSRSSRRSRIGGSTSSGRTISTGATSSTSPCRSISRRR